MRRMLSGLVLGNESADQRPVLLLSDSGGM